MMKKKRASQNTKGPHTIDRKDSHLAICLNEDVDYSTRKDQRSGLEGYQFEHLALPELDFRSITTDTKLFGRALRSPIIIGAMTGGTKTTDALNRRLAAASEAHQIPFALGSQRKALESTDKQIWSSFAVKKWNPKIPLLFGNIGAVQLNYGIDADKIERLVDYCEIDVLNIHLNPLQEVIQPEGNTNFLGLLKKIEKVATHLNRRFKLPVVLKEVGSGISKTMARRLNQLPIAGIETAGVGGTSWSKIESLRSQSDKLYIAGSIYAQWGISTADSVVAVKSMVTNKTVIASGGIRNGLEVAKCLALGADACAAALPFLKAAQKSENELQEFIDGFNYQLRIAMFLTGSQNLNELKKQKLLKHYAN